ncbi:CRISPR-associated protein (Cas_Cmr5) [Alysiella filiformis DSM 16848]|uniref:CRISPR type III-B/RAMP module-associated protein Cmr5 n=2 Tax=Alysiella TaxID=194195 RepID=A0A286EDA5_9NEIS|nr:type III-B CRISPR module-associated protein Cmr5 [Alysiella filiformis]SOD68883.1 CRISPR-associated protein (Cas_Cmr5) [Alysiella filiformis DSM 16848]
MNNIRSQKMAQAAYPLVEKMQATHLKDEYFKNEESDEKALKMAQSLSAKYRTLALNFPSMILQSGLSQTIGFLLAKGSLKENEPAENKHDKDKSKKTKVNEHLLLLRHLAKLLSDEQNKYDENSLHEKILQADLAEYQLLTRKALDASSCLKRYTQALLESEKDKGKANE